MDNTTVAHYAGIDWATDTHAVCIIDHQGAITERFTVTHSAGGLGELCRRLRHAGVTRVSIERPDGPVIDTLMRARLEVVVIPSRQVKGLRSRYGGAGNKDDASDARILADTLRTDAHRYRTLQRDSPATVHLRQLVRTRTDLVRARVAATNQLRAHLQVAFPGVVGLFWAIDSPISLRFLERFPTQATAAWLSPARLASWLTHHRYSGRVDPAALYRRLEQAPRGADHDQRTDPVVAAHVAILAALRTQIHALEVAIGDALNAHPDATIFTSLPRAGTIRAATLLAEIGDCRARFPDAQSLAALAGVVPSTRQSGTHRTVAFRWAANTRLREALCDFAGDSPRANAWADHRYRQLRAAGKRHPHAARILARSWAHIIWRCWHDRVPYDPARHHALQTLNAAGGLT